MLLLLLLSFQLANFQLNSTLTASGGKQNVLALFIWNLVIHLH